MKTTKTFENASLVSVVNGSIVVKSAAGIEHTFTNASVVSVNNGTIIIESEWTPKEGELVKAIGCHIDCYIIFQSMDHKFLYTYGGKELRGSYISWTSDTWAYDKHLEILPVTPAEQQAFDDFCKSQGKIWNKEKLQWEKYQWKPKKDERYYFLTDLGKINYTKNDTLDLDFRRIECGNCFQTKEKAELAAEKVKELLKSL